MMQMENERVTQNPMPADTCEAIDREALAELWEDLDEDETLMSEMVSLYLEDTPKQIVNAQQALESADNQSLSRIAHTLKGSSLYYGAKKLSKVCKDLEAVCGQDNLAAADYLVHDLAREFDLVKSALQALIVNRG
jgi:HPt (histidine-containing phosphotransfer) domain-containing protein